MFARTQLWSPGRRVSTGDDHPVSGERPACILGRPPLPQALSEIFDDVARELETHGFEVIRNPLPLTYVDDPEARQRFWYFATSNNCLV
jgi:hypothetical protein